MNNAGKVIKIGNSFGVVLSRDILAKLRVQLGDSIFFSETPGGVEMRPNDPAFAAAMAAAEEVMREDRDILAVLAK